MNEPDTILLVDDAPDSLAAMSEALIAEGFQVLSADSGELALAAVEARPPALILLDIRMPGMDGFEVCRRLKARERTRDIPVIFLTALTEVEDRVAGFKHGAVDYVTKPFQREECLARIRTHLELSRLNATLRERTAELELAVVQSGKEAGERRRAEESLREGEERYRLISENTSDVIWLLDVASGRFTYVSPSVWRLRGYSPEEVMAQSLQDVLTPDSYQLVATRLPEWVAAFEAGDESVRTQTNEVDQPRKDGSIVHTEVATTLLADDQGRVRKILGVTRDITERKQAEAKLMQAQKMESIGRLAGGVAHDFNNLLTVINGYSQLLLGKLSAGNPLRASLDQIHKAGERAAKLTGQLLAFSRKQVLEPRVLDLNQVVGEMQSMLARLVGEDVKLRVELNAEGGMVHADPQQLEQVVMNLVVNARDAMSHGGQLLIETACVEFGESYARSHPEARLGRYVMLAMSDSGAGMDEETRRRIFEPFFTTKGIGKGTGLGLSMVQGIVDQSGGRIEVYSEPGHGTTFKIYLPRVGEAVADARVPETVPTPEGQETVLVVEDQAEVRKYAVAVLKDYGYRIIQAESAGEALSLCERERIDLLLTDVVMPNVSGRELANRLEEFQPGIKILFMSGYTDNVIAHHGVLDEGAHFIQKPFGPEQLAAKVREVLGPPVSAELPLARVA